MSGLLIVDDTPIIRATIRRAVARQGIGFDPVVEARNGAEAIAFACRDRPEVVLMDIKMPGIDGLEAAARIRAQVPHAQLVFLTAYDEFAYVQRALKLGAADFLLKPIRPARLVEILLALRARAAEASGAPAPAPRQEAAAEPPPPRGPAARDPVGRAVAFVRENFADPAISLAEVSRVAHLSPSHLAHRFKESTGLSYKRFLTEQRIEAAKTLLETTSLTVDAIAEQVGYQNATNFYRLFQRTTESTPAAYRKTAHTENAKG